VLTYHNDAESHLWGGITKLVAFVYGSLASILIRRAQAVVSSTRSYAETSVALKYSMNKLKIIPMGVDASRYDGFEPTVAEESLERNLLFVGQLKEYKGVEVLLDALFLLRSEGHFINVNIVGTGPVLENLKRKTKSLGIENNVRFLGSVSDRELMQLYATCDSLVLPSLNRREAFGIVLLEAMAAGRTVVASDIPGVNEVATMAGGFLARPNDARSLADSITKSLKNQRHPDDIRKVAQEHSWDKLAAKYEAVFEELITTE
ncbi:MAG: glycosyltransferase, partial [Rhabdochlamydiaceae bacterium]